MTYRAIDIAKYITFYCIHQRNEPITNLHLQHILYLLWIDYYKQTGEMLFKDDFKAWKHGPVIEEVYEEYKNYVGSPIRMVDTEIIIEENKGLINDLINIYADKEAFELVDLNTTTEKPWDVTFRSGKGAYSVISKDRIIELECK